MTQLPDLPALVAQTQNFSLGQPRSFTIIPGGVLFLRSRSGTDPVHDLWCLPIDGNGFGQAYCLVDAHEGADVALSPEEQARRERVRERAQGIVAFSVNKAGDRCAFSWGDGVGVVAITPGAKVQTLPTPGVLAQPTISPDGNHIAGVINGALWVLDVPDGAARCLAQEDGKVTWGVADFIAAEEMGRTQGFWWGPDSQHLAVTRVDNTDLDDWWISAPVDPERPSVPMAYPPAGGVNASVSLWNVGLDGQRTALDVKVGPKEGFEYLASVQWLDANRIVASVQRRDQRLVRTLGVPVTGAPAWVIDDNEQHPYVELIPGLPYAIAGEDEQIHLLTPRIRDNQRGVALDGVIVGPGQADWTLTGVSGVLTDGPLRIGANGIPSATPWENEGGIITDDGITSYGGTVTLGNGGIDGEGVMVLRTTSLDGPPQTKVVLVDRDETPELILESFATPLPETGVALYGPIKGNGRTRSLLLIPGKWVPSDGPLPVLVNSYGGPHARMVINDRTRLYEAAFFAAQGYAVVVTDGPGAPGGGVEGEYVIYKNLHATIQGQIDALDTIEDQFPGVLDRSRVAIRGWSYGGYLSARAVLERPDVFKAGLAGAPVTDWRLYDTQYTERYLGNPNEDLEAYLAEELAQIAQGIDPATWNARLLLIHGLADDNVVMAHTLRLSSALLAQGLFHEVLPLSDVTHFTPSVTINTNLLLHELDFLRRYC